MTAGYPNALQEILNSKKNVLLTDGAARGNPGPAGWAYILLSGEKNIAEERTGFSARDTNNRMEMLGALHGLEAQKNYGLINETYLITDSSFVIEALSKWRHTWKKNGWKKSDGTDVLHQDIWRQLDPAFEQLKPQLLHIEAHKGHPGNTRCDFLAVAAATNKKAGEYRGALDQYPHFSKIAHETYPTPRYLCWKGKDHKEFRTWPEAQEFLKQNPSFRTKKIFSPEEIEVLKGS